MPACRVRTFLAAGRRLHGARIFRADIGLAGDQLANAVGEIFVVRHARIIFHGEGDKHSSFARRAGVVRSAPTAIPAPR
jgi:hypothetical protein